MSTTTALDLINEALSVLQVKSDDVVLTSKESNDGLDALNELLEHLSLQTLMIYHVEKNTGTINSGVQVYTIGATGDITIPRPTEIDKLVITYNGLDYTMTELQYDDWAAIRLKTLNTVYPEFFYYDKTWPNGTLYVYPVPSQVMTLTIYGKSQLQTFPTLTTPINLPPGYKRMLKYGLAIDLAPTYQTSAGQDVINLYNGAKMALKNTNFIPTTRVTDLAGMQTGRYNIYTGR
jgi:hypothetical protein